MVKVRFVTEAAALSQLIHSSHDEGDFQRQVLKEGLPEALAMLPPRQREVFVARAVDATPFDVLAEKYGESEANIRTHYSRARRTLEGLIGVLNN